MSIMKLSKTQEEVVRLMREGWEMACLGAPSYRYFLQQGGRGRGGKTKKISYATVHALERLDIIKVNKSNYLGTTYKLKESLT